MSMFHFPLTLLNIVPLDHGDQFGDQFLYRIFSGHLDELRQVTDIRIKQLQHLFNRLLVPVSRLLDEDQCVFMFSRMVLNAFFFYLLTACWLNWSSVATSFSVYPSRYNLLTMYRAFSDGIINSSSLI